MKWLKLGKIFDPAEHGLSNNGFLYAQAPQALVFDDFVRIYFSTREKNIENGKYLSHIAFIDMSKDFQKITGHSSKTVIELGKLGCFDEHGIFPMNILRHGDKIYGYTCGWSRRVSVSIDTSIGLAISHDKGITFQKVGDGPILTSSLHEPYLISDPFVAHYEGTFHMWYIFGVKWKRFLDNEEPDRVYKIGHATSQDGIVWQKEECRQIISDTLNADECQALPTVIRFSDKYHMFFCYRHSFNFRKHAGRGYRIGYAWSEDLATWTRDDDSVGIDVSEGGWDSDMMCYPHVFECEGRIFMLYNGNEFGRYGFGLAVLEREKG